MEQIYPYQSIYHDDNYEIQVTAHVFLPAVVSNMLVLVDYVSNDSAVPSLWPWRVLERFDDGEREALLNLSPLLVHGLVLQEHWIRTIPFENAAAHSWDALRRTVENYSDHEIRNLLSVGWVSGMQFYLHEMKRNDELDKLLPANAASITVDDLLADTELLDELFEFSYASWGVPKANWQTCIEFAKNPDNVRSSILKLIDAIWNHGGRHHWKSGSAGLKNWHQQAEETIDSRHWNNTVKAVEELAGHTPPERTSRLIEPAQRVALLPCLEMGASQRVVVCDETAYLMFEPPTFGTARESSAIDPMELADAVATLRAITDPAAFSLLQELGSRNELYALELSEVTKIHQSTVSRHLNQLERYGVVRVRREGKTKHYQLQRDRVDLALRTIRIALGD